MTMAATAFAPGHISGFFDPVYKPTYDQSGSRGAGININLGATTTVTIAESSQQNIQIWINNKLSPAPVTKLAINYLIEDTKICVQVNTKLDLPIGQGFGLSGAGALSTTLALAHILHLPKEDALKAAHFAEVHLRTGLSDVIASFFGGIEIRREPGLPPWGLIEHIPGDYEIVLGIIGKKLLTKTILKNKNKLNEISLHGKYCTKQILEKPTMEHLLHLSQHFSIETTLASPEVLQAIQVTKPVGKTSMCMLGNSVFAIGKTPQLCQLLSKISKKIYLCHVDVCGARILIS